MPSPEVINLTLSDDKIQPYPIRSDQGPPTPTQATNRFITENVAKDTFKGSLFDCQENVSHYTYYCLNNQCEY